MAKIVDSRFTVFFNGDNNAPDLRTSAAGTPYIKFNLSEYTGKNQDGTYKPNKKWKGVAFGDTATAIAEHVPHGKQITVNVGFTGLDVFTGSEGNTVMLDTLKVEDFALYQAGSATGTAASAAKTTFGGKTVRPPVQHPANITY